MVPEVLPARVGRAARTVELEASEPLQEHSFPDRSYKVPEAV